MSDLGKSIGLIHELRKLAATKEFFHGCHHRAYVDERVGSGLPWLLDTHTLLDNTLHTQQTNTKLGLDEFTHRAYAAIAEVVDIVFASMAVIQLNQAAHDVDQVILCQGTLALGYREVQLPIELVASHTTQVITPRVEEHVLYKRTGIIDRSWIARAHLLIEFKQCLILSFDRIAIQRRLDVTNIDIVIGIPESVEDALVG